MPTPAVQSFATLRYLIDAPCPAGHEAATALYDGTPTCKKPLPILDAPICPAPQEGAAAGNPILPATADKLQIETDFIDSGPAPLSFTRTYRSTWGADATRAVAAMGKAWANNHEVWLLVRPTDAFIRYLESLLPVVLPKTVNIFTAEGQVAHFIQLPGSSGWSRMHSADALTPSGGGWSWRRSEDDATLNFDAQGRLSSRVERNGWTFTYAYDAAGRLASVTNPFGRTLQFAYNATGRLAQITTPDGRNIGYGYDGADRLTTVGYADGKTRTYLYENAAFPHALTGIVDESGARFATFAYDGAGRAISTQHAGGADSYQVGYPAAGQATITDPLGTARSYSYGGKAGRLAVTSATLPSGAGHADAASRVQDDQGLRTSETDFNGSVSTITWDVARRLPTDQFRAVGTSDVQGFSTQWHPTFSLPETIYEAGRWTAYTYDALGNMLTRTATDATDGSVYPYPSKTTRWTYNSSNLVATETAPNGAVTSYVYDARGNPTRVTNALGHVTTYAYDSANRVISSTAPSGLVSTYAWDARDRLLSRTVGGQTTSFSYRSTGQLATLALPSGLVLNYSYDAAQRLTGWSNNRGESGSYTLDAMGNRVIEQVSNSGAGGIAWQVARSINAINRVQSETVGQNTTFGYGYDANGELISVSDGLNATTAYGRDALRRIASVVDSSGAAAALNYDGLDAVTGAADSKQVATGYARDAQGNAAYEASADAGTIRTSYDQLGLPSRIVDALGQATDITRDALGRPTRLAWADAASTTLRYDVAGSSYNAAGAPNASRGYLSEIQDSGVTTRWQRDALGRVTQKTQIVTGTTPTTQTIGYSYVASGAGAGQLAAIAYPAGAGTLGYQYDASGWLVGLSWNGVPLVNNIAWSALGRPTGWRWSFVTGAPLMASRSYDTAGQLASSELASYQYDAAGRITSIGQSLMAPSGSGNAIAPLQVNTTFSYDSEGRITGMQHSLLSGTLPADIRLSDLIGPIQANFQYDFNGNRVQSSYQQPAATAGGSDSLVRSYNIQPDGNRLLGYTQTSTVNGASATLANPFQYDAAGRLTSTGSNNNAAANDKTYTLAYGVSGRLIQSSPSGQPAQKTTYRHNLLGQRVFKITPGSGAGTKAVTLYGEESHEMQSQPMTQLDGAGAVKALYIYLPTPQGPMPIAALIAGNWYAVHSDHLNTPRRLVQSDGQIAWQWSYSAFGEVPPTTGATRFVSPLAGATQTGATATVTFDLRYPGQVADAESGLFYNHHRSYDPITGRYIQFDPIGLAGGWNRYTYVQGNPISFVDPMGLDLTPAQQAAVRAVTLDWAKSGVPYVFGGADKKGADCSGSISEIYRQAGIDIGRMTSGQFKNSPLFGPAKGDRQIGDIAVFSGHVSIYGGETDVSGRDIFSASRTGGPVFGPSKSSWFGNPTWIRYQRP